MDLKTDKSQYTVLLISDDYQDMEQNQSVLIDAGISSALILVDIRAVLPLLEQHCISLVILKMTTSIVSDGLLSRICANYPHIPVVVETTLCDVELAVNCMKLGAVDYIVRPFEAERLISSVENALNSITLQQEATSLKECLLNDRLLYAEAFAEILTISRKMRVLFQYTEIVARSPQAVLITGETGVGKELFARAIHRISRVRGQFVSINVAGLDDAMFSDTLFGHKKGAFTGADQYRDGLVGKAERGTLFLDEIGDLNEMSQVKLLRLLQEREYYPVGADMVKNSTARIVLATNVNLQERIKDGKFRKDLYFRLCSHQIHIPALRERLEDIPLLLESFINDAARNFNKNIPEISPQLVPALTEYNFPGNVRELQARVSDAVARHEEGELTVDDFPGLSTTVPQNSTSQYLAHTSGTPGIYSLFGRLPTFREIEDFLIVEALRVSGGSCAVAASMLGVTRQTISKRLKSIGTES